MQSRAMAHCKLATLPHALLLSTIVMHVWVATFDQYKSGTHMLNFWAQVSVTE